MMKRNIIYNGISESDNNNYLADTYQQVNPTKLSFKSTGDGDFDTYCVQLMIKMAH